MSKTRVAVHTCMHVNRPGHYRGATAQLLLPYVPHLDSAGGLECEHLALPSSH